MVRLKGLDNDICLGMANYCPISVFITWLGLGVYIVICTYRGEWKDAVSVHAYTNWPTDMNITRWIVYSVKKIRGFELQVSFENWECAKISLLQKVSSPESAKICLRQNFSFYRIRIIVLKYIPLFKDIVINLQSSSIYFKDIFKWIKDTFNH